MSDADEDQGAVDAATANEAAVSTGERPATLANFVDEDAGFRGGDLPLWNRLDGGRSRASGRGRLIAATAWCAALALASIALLRIAFHDAAWPLVLLNAFTFYIYLPAYAIFVFAIVTKRRTLALLSAAIIACHAAWVSPDFRAAGRAAAAVDASADARAIRIYYANVHARNQDLEGILAEIRRYDPDVVVLAEMQRWWWTQFISRNPLPDYRYGTNLQRRNAGDIGVFSRLSVSRLEQIAVAGRVVLAVDLEIGDERIRMYAVHSPRPTPDSRDSYCQFWDVIGRRATMEQGPVVLIGDFNATQYSRVYRELQEGGLRSAHEDRGRGLARTWPNNRSPIALIRIDQAFLSPQVECLSILEGEAPGSDHKPLIVDLVVRRTVATSSER